MIRETKSREKQIKKKHEKMAKCKQKGKKMGDKK
jgi:hypothetical protein